MDVKHCGLNKYIWSETASQRSLAFSRHTEKVEIKRQEATAAPPLRRPPLKCYGIELTGAVCWALKANRTNKTGASPMQTLSPLAAVSCTWFRYPKYQSSCYHINYDRSQAAGMIESGLGSGRTSNAVTQICQRQRATSRSKISRAVS